MTDASLPDTTPLPQKATFVGNLALGNEVSDIFILSSARQGQARNGLYWLLEFKDASGGIGGKIWSPQSLAFPDLQAGCMVHVSGRVGSYRDKLELSIDAMRLLSESEAASLNLADFMPASARRPEDMLEELRVLGRKELTHKPWRKLVAAVLDDKEIHQALLTAPAAKSMHHAYAGGLIEHTLSVTRLSLSIAGQYPQLDRQLIFAGAVCHDLGKIWELSSGLAVDYTQAGRLLGHISLGMEKLAGHIRKSGLEPELAEHLQHLILSHHGTREFGSPTLPATAEALVLHYADNIDAKMQQVEAALAHLAPGESGWSAYVPSMERFLFRAVRTPESPSPASRASGLKKEMPAGSAAMKQPAALVGEERMSEQPLPLISQCSLLSKE